MTDFPNAAAVHDMSGKELLALFNKHAKEGGQKATKRFASHESGVTRVLGLISDIKAGTKKAAKGEAKEKSKAQLLNERAGRERTKSAKKAPAAVKAAPARKPVAASTSDGHRAYKDQTRPAVSPGYLPKPGSIQDKLLAHLRAAGDRGVQVDKLCDFLNGIRRGSVPITRANLWTEITYILCHNRGYGMRSEGERISVIIPKQEKDHNGKAK